MRGKDRNGAALSLVYETRVRLRPLSPRGRSDIVKIDAADGRHPQAAQLSRTAAVSAYPPCRAGPGRTDLALASPVSPRCRRRRIGRTMRCRLAAPRVPGAGRLAASQHRCRLLLLTTRRWCNAVGTMDCDVMGGHVGDPDINMSSSDKHKLDVAWNNCFRKMSNACWR